MSSASPDGKAACITLDLESDWYVDESGESYYTFEYLPEYVEIMRELNAPVSVFVVGKLLEDRPDAVETIREGLDAEFHLHSYSHDPEMEDGFRNDLQRGVEAFESFFGHRPRGYRAPLGKITDEQLRILDEEGFEFDSSVFPSYRPGAYNNLDAPTEPYRPTAGSLIEFPVGVAPYFRVPVAQSYLKLGGRPYLKLLDAMELPDPLIFVSHLHDFFDTEAHEHRDQPIRTVHKRNIHDSPDLLAELVRSLRDSGYQFSTIGDIYRPYGSP